MKLIAALLLVAAVPQADRMLTPAAFRDRLAAAMQALTHHAAGITGEQSFRIKDARNVELTVNTDTAFAQYRADPSQRDEIIARYVRLLLAGHEGGGDVDQLVAIVRPTNYIMRSLPPGTSTANFLPSRPMAGDLSFFLAVDSPESIRIADLDDLKRWNLTVDQAWTRAITDIKRRMGTIQPVSLGGEGGASGFAAESGLAPSLLADPSMCGPASPDGVDHQVILLYARDTYLYAVPSDRGETAAFWSEVRRVRSDRSALSDTPLTCRGGKWVVATPP